MAICSLGAMSSKDCKFDAFKIVQGGTPCTSECPVPPAFDLTVSKTAAPTMTRTYSWDSAKSVDPSGTVDTADTTKTATYTATATWSGPTDSAWQVQGMITVTNPNTGIDFTGVNVSDVISSGGSADTHATCTVTDSSNNDASVTSETIPAGGSVDFSYTCTYDSHGPASYSESNVATATWDPASNGNTPDSSASNDPVAVTFNDGTTGNPTVVGGSETVTDTFNGASNPDTLGTVDVNGNFDTSGATVTEVSGYPQYDPKTQTYTFQYQRTLDVVAGACTTYPNTVGLTGVTDPTPTDNTASVKLCGGADLTGQKTATPNFARTYNWSITKNVDKTLIETTGSTATFHYTVTVSETGFTDGSYEVDGSITAYNPNLWEAVTVSMSDAIKTQTGWTCTVDDGTGTNTFVATATNISVPEATDATHPGTASRNYKCTWSGSGVPNSGTNTATISWDKSAAYTPDNSASPTAGFGAFTTPTTLTNQKVDATDCFYLSTLMCTNPTSLGSQLTATNTKPYTTATYTYSRTVNVPSGSCLKYDNTATITETMQSQSKEVEVCGPVLGGLTMGFWQNKNGQGLITNTTYSGTTCSALRTYLTSFNPFKDFPGTKYGATCAGIASYVSDVIKAATCSSTTNTCNSMLKAQMLATALDVFFSEAPGDPIKGFNGNIGTDLGTVKIDLTAICAMSDGTGGATCGGSENATAAFPGLGTCVSISTLLGFSNATGTYAWGTTYVSNTGGVNWYNQKKTTQVLAKDTFDTFNNQRAFPCP
jgi:hypothetical protein